MEKEKTIQAENQVSLGKPDFKDGVAFVFEEMFLLGYEDRDTAIDLLKTTFSPYIEDITKTMIKNNPDIYKERVLPELKQENII